MPDEPLPDPPDAVRAVVPVPPVRAPAAPAREPAALGLPPVADPVRPPAVEPAPPETEDPRAEPAWEPDDPPMTPEVPTRLPAVLPMAAGAPAGADEPPSETAERAPDARGTSGRARCPGDTTHGATGRGTGRASSRAGQGPGRGYVAPGYDAVDRTVSGGRPVQARGPRRLVTRGEPRSSDPATECGAARHVGAA